MHFLESYALVSGTPISKPFIKVEPIELPSKKYITFHPYCKKAPTRQYRSWVKVLELLIGDSNFDWEIVQVGGKKDEVYNGVNTDYLGNTSTHQLAYLIQNSGLHLGYDSFPVHLASHFARNIVAIYNMPPSISGPYFSDPKDVVLLEPEYPIVTNFVNGRFIEQKARISHSHMDELDLINTIKPENIYDGVKKLLDF